MLDSNKVKNKLTVEDIIKICCYLQGSDEYLYKDGCPIFNTCLNHSGGDSWKLYYFPDSKLFHVFTRGESYDIFELVRRAKGFETFKEAFDFVVKFFHLRSKGFDDDTAEVELTSDWDIFQKIKDYSKEVSMVPEPIKPVQENIMEYFYPLAAPEEWLKEGISAEVMRYYNIRVDSALHKIIIEHRDIDGKLVGIRGRTYDPFELQGGKKYMPVFVQGDLYNHPLGKNLYGLYQNKDVIKRIGKVFVAEGEKSVLQLASMYGAKNCWAVATCGSSFSKDQMNLLLSLGVTEIILGYDREFDGHRGDPDTIEYEQKLLKIISPLLPYVNVSVIMDYDHLLPQKKMSPTDAGKEIFEQLYHERVRLYMQDGKIMRKIKNKRK